MPKPTIYASEWREHPECASGQDGSILLLDRVPLRLEFGHGLVGPPQVAASRLQVLDLPFGIVQPMKEKRRSDDFTVCLLREVGDLLG